VRESLLIVEVEQLDLQVGDQPRRAAGRVQGAVMEVRSMYIDKISGRY
jgi:hypothetical protein